MTKLRIGLLFFFLGHLFYLPSVQASPIHIGAATFLSDFPGGIIATLEVTPEAPLVQARLHVTLDGVRIFSQDAPLPVHQGGESIRLETRWNGLSLTRDPSPPWMPLQLWWLLTDANGTSITTAPSQHTYRDDRLRAWTLTEGVHVSVYTYGQSSNFAAQAVGFGDEAVASLGSVYGYALPYRPAIVIYNSAAQGDADLGANGRAPFGAYVVGRAYPGTSGVVLLARADSAYMQRTIKHEITHLFQYQIGANLFEAPHWWIEGDAKAQEPAASVQRSLSYAQRVALGGGLPDLTTWDSRSAASETDLDHALLLGASFVTYLNQIYGTGAHAAFYLNWRDQGSFSGAFVATYGKTLGELAAGWGGWLLNNTSIAAAPAENAAVSTPIVILPEIPPGMARVNAYWLNFRAGPSTEFDALAVLSIGQLLLPIGRDESQEWVLVELPDGAQGWLYSEFIDYDGSIDDLVVSLY